MGLQEVISWYQKKIGTYDKQQWERTVEQRILDGITHVPMKTARVKTELIDVDLVRGSSFPKAKPKHGLVTVARLALLRLVFLPIYSRWWVEQTSARIFGLLLALYGLQCVNLAAYTYHNEKYDGEHEKVTISELIVPMAMMLLLSAIHSQIVSTNIGPTKTPPRRVRRGARKRRRPSFARSRSSNLGTEANNKPSSVDTTVTTTAVAKSTATAAAESDTNNSSNNNKYFQQRTTTTRVRITQSDTHNKNAAKTSSTRRVVAWDSPVHITTQLSIETNSGSNKKPCIQMESLDPNDDEEFISAEISDSMLAVEDCSSLQLFSSVIRPPVASCQGDREDERDLPATNRDEGNPRRRELIGGEVDDQLLLQGDERNQQMPPLDDDGFESLNGNGSSENGEDPSNANNSNNNNHRGSSTDGNRSDHSTPRNHDLGETHSQSSATTTTTKYFDTQIENAAIGCLNVKTKFTSIAEGMDAQRMTLLTQGGDAGGPITIIHSLAPDEDSKSQEPVYCRYDTELRKAWVHEVLENRSPAAGMTTEKKPANGSDTDTDTLETLMNSNSSLLRRRGSQPRRNSGNSVNHHQDDTTTGGGATSRRHHHHHRHRESSGDTEEEGDCETVSTPGTVGSCCPLLNEATPSATEWIGVTTNSEECSYSSELEETDSQFEYSNMDFVDHPFAWEFGSNTVLSPSCAASDRVSCTVWDRREIKKADLSVLDISSTIIARVEGMPETCDYFYGGLTLSVLLACIPAVCRLCRATIETSHPDEHLSIVDLVSLVGEKMSGSLVTLVDMGFGASLSARLILVIALIQRIILSSLFFFLLAVAERVFKQRFLYAKLFSQLTSSRRARKSELPHFRLNKVRNIKTWLSIRSYLKKRGPQRSVDVIVSAACLITLLLLSFLSVELLRDSVHLHSQYNVEAFCWSLALGTFLLRFMTLGTKINQKYRNLSVLITEQINLYLQIEQKPHKKDELMVANSVLKLAADLLKELESPFKISGLSANPILYTITKVVILSALSGILSEMLGFKLKLHKIKIK